MTTAPCPIAPTKARFRTEDEADRRAKKHGLRSYYCRECRGFHLTSAGYSQTRALRAKKPSAAVELARAERALAELERKGVVGPLLDAARARVSGLRGGHL